VPDGGGVQGDGLGDQVVGGGGAEAGQEAGELGCGALGRGDGGLVAGQQFAGLAGRGREVSVGAGQVAGLGEQVNLAVLGRVDKGAG
jgi:hypothetical protein